MYLKTAFIFLKPDHSANLREVCSRKARRSHTHCSNTKIAISRTPSVNIEIASSFFTILDQTYVQYFKKTSPPQVTVILNNSSLNDANKPVHFKEFTHKQRNIYYYQHSSSWSTLTYLLSFKSYCIVLIILSYLIVFSFKCCQYLVSLEFCFPILGLQIPAQNNRIKIKPVCELYGPKQCAHLKSGFNQTSQKMIELIQISDCESQLSEK